MFKRHIISTLVFSYLLLFPSVARSQTSTYSPPGQVTSEIDGSPELRCLSYKFVNGSVTDNGDGSCSLLGIGQGTTLVSGDCDNSAEAGNLFVDTDAASGSQLYVCEGAAGWVLSSGGGTTLINNLGDADGAGTIALAGNQQTWTSTLNSAGANLTFTNTTADLTSDVSFIDMKYTDDGDANGYYLRGYDNAAADLKWSIDSDGVFTGTRFEAAANSTAAGFIKLFEDTDDGSNFYQINGVATAADLSWILPATNGTAGQVLEIASVSSNELTLEWDADGGGGGTGFIELPVQSAKLTGGFITSGARIDAGDGNWRLLFDTASTESGLWQFRMPSTYSSAPIAKLQYSMVSATSGKVDWEVDVQAVADGEAVITASFDTTNEVSGGTTVPGTAGLLDSISIALSNDDSVAAGELVYIRVNRDHDDADDTATGDAELVGLTIEWTE